MNSNITPFKIKTPYDNNIGPRFSLTIKKQKQHAEMAGTIASKPMLFYFNYL